MFRRIVPPRCPLRLDNEKYILKVGQESRNFSGRRVISPHRLTFARLIDSIFCGCFIYKTIERLRCNKSGRPYQWPATVSRKKPLQSKNEGKNSIGVTAKTRTLNFPFKILVRFSCLSCDIDVLYCKDILDAAFLSYLLILL